MIDCSADRSPPLTTLQPSRTTTTVCILKQSLTCTHSRQMVWGVGGIRLPICIKMSGIEIERLRGRHAVRACLSSKMTSTGDSFRMLRSSGLSAAVHYMSGTTQKISYLVRVVQHPRDRLRTPCATQFMKRVVLILLIKTADVVFVFPVLRCR